MVSLEHSIIFKVPKVKIRIMSVCPLNDKLNLAPEIWSSLHSVVSACWVSGITPGAGTPALDGAYVLLREAVNARSRPSESMLFLMGGQAKSLRSNAIWPGT